MMWMALLLSVLSSKADGAIDAVGSGTTVSPGLATASTQIPPESQTSLSFEPPTFHASVGCPAFPGEGALRQRQEAQGRLARVVQHPFGGARLPARTEPFEDLFAFFAASPNLAVWKSTHPCLPFLDSRMSLILL
jgi:hypothetical protein